MADAAENSTGAKDVQPIRQSEIFNAADADVVIRSCDNVEFRLHKKNLEFLSGGFPPADTETNPNEIFMYPQRFPSLDNMKFDPLIELAETAEKYEIFALIHICEVHLRSFMRQHPREILRFAAKYDHRELVKELAPILVPYLPLSELSDLLPAHLYKPWSLYRAHWMKEAILTIANSHPHNCYERTDKVRWGATLVPLTLHQSLLSSPFLHNTDNYWKSLVLQYDSKPCCVSVIEGIRGQLGCIVNNIPSLQLPTAQVRASVTGTF
ncbi:hypothetical protein C8J55DRAFT_548967 [Lentinula edodes]|uniref:BTB domain-containing protein n=1 Tax=Lentinula lateritia TaxID=40482 RepID=A0A9W9DRT4_9AGAR|nr:hypothetical protein C8J55DRAFT_548967 [Lentinula edodes]